MLGIYVHWPFCLRKCAYCSFVSMPDCSARDTYAQCLMREMETFCDLKGMQTDSIFYGGGTPSLCPPEQFVRIAEALGDFFDLCLNAEITLEANPGTLDISILDAAKSAGVNRLSIGLQATRDHHLRLLGRIHDLTQFEESLGAARAAGFDNINIDLIYGFPTQTMADWQETLGYVLSLAPEHISLYALSLEESTPLHESVRSGRLPPIDDDLAADMYVEARAVLGEAGFENYEISNFARGGRECRHNLKYWTGQDYLGLGAAAHSCVAGTRFANTGSVEEYINRLKEGRSAQDYRERMDLLEQEREFLMLRTRLGEGFSLKEREELFGRRETPGLERAICEGLVRSVEGRIRPTEKGFLFQNRLALLCMDDVPIGKEECLTHRTKGV